MKIDEILKCDDNNVAFDSFKELVDENLRRACIPFSMYFHVDIDGLFKLFKYDYRSLLTITLCNVFNELGAEISKDFTRVKLIRDVMANSFEGQDESIRKRLERCLEGFEKRNERHLKYLDISDKFSPKIRYVDRYYYQLLSDFPIMKRFLLNEEAIITKKFFDVLPNFYSEMDKYKGYYKFYLHYKFECDSKIEFFYKGLSIIKKIKSSKKLSDDIVYGAIGGLSNLHNIPIMDEYTKEIVTVLDLTKIYNEILSVPEGQRMISGIVFGIDNILNIFKNNIYGINIVATAIHLLNIIQRATVDYTLGSILAVAEEQQIQYEKIEAIFLSDNASSFFESYLNDYDYISHNKKCSKDITFDHFKTLYKIKKEPSRKK